jgi:hypothetical protein
MLPTTTKRECAWCEELILAGEQHSQFQVPMHQECAVRATQGSVAHLRRECSCFQQGSTKGDPEGLSKRDAALAAYDAWIETVAAEPSGRWRWCQ